ncbi:MAG TPA: MBL fold metallo-hydrolase [Spirochaetota bacterium]|nr:MBL fold metallo-hydrolase [Spirochaetota bacterium]HPI88842.1 MBL fold metallo-hydrolase [Spirochaetota bacterium]HPR47670.1 MBL fold metallo-hydrolase [Spirochaetota bacterium]
MFQVINDHISMIFTEQGFTFSNCMIIDDEVRTAIDSGAGKIMKSIDPASVDILLISHHHIDHINGNDYFTRAKILAHPLEKEAMSDPMKTTATWGWGELMDEDIMQYAENLTGKMKRVLEPWPVHGTFNDRDVFDCGKTKVMVIHTPGHTSGHCSFYFPDEEFMFTGDICLSRVGPWYGEPDTTIDEFTASVDLIDGFKPKKLATGHVNTIITENIHDILMEYKERIYKREKRIINFLKKGPATINAMAQRKLIYGLHPTTFVLFWEKSMLKKHLDRLIDMGTVKKDEADKYYLTSSRG